MRQNKFVGVSILQILLRSKGDIIMKIKFANGTEFNYLNAIEAEEYYNGASRRTLTFECSADTISVDMLNAVLSDEANTASIKLLGEPVPVSVVHDATYASEVDRRPLGKVTEEVKDEADVVGHYVTPESIYDDYVLKLKCGIESVLVYSETPESTAVYADKLIFKLGKPTYIEHQLKKLGL